MGDNMTGSASYVYLAKFEKKEKEKGFQHGHVTSSTSKHHSKGKQPHSLKLLLYHCIDYQAGSTVAPRAPGVMNKSEMIGPEKA